MTTTVDLAHYFDYLCKARETLPGWVAGQPVEAYTRSFPFGLGSIRATLVHTAAGQWGYTERLAGQDFLPAHNPFSEDRYRELRPLMVAWAGETPRTRQVLADLGNGSRRIEYIYRAADRPRRIRATAGGIAAQLFCHEVHHRAQVMAMLRHLGVEAQDLDYNNLMYERLE